MVVIKSNAYTEEDREDWKRKRRMRGGTPNVQDMNCTPEKSRFMP